MNELALFAGAGGGILGGSLLGWRTICAVEYEPYAASVLVARQNDGFLPPFPVWDDVRTFDGKPWRGIVDVVSGGFPCQDISAAGRGVGIDGERSGLWAEMARIIGEVRPPYVFVENSPLLVSRGLVRVLGDLASLGFDARWGIVGADDVGAPHERKRCWVVANSRGARWDEGSLRKRGNNEQKIGERWSAIASEPSQASSSLAHSNSNEHQSAPYARLRKWKEERGEIIWGDWTIEPDLGRVANGVAARMDRLKALGNGQVPQCAAEAWRLCRD